MESSIGRRELLLTALAAPLASGLAPASARSVRAFRLVETAGLRRFGYPVQTVVPDAVEGRNFRLLRNGSVIPAQFRAVEVSAGRRELVLDFTASPEPLETQQYEVLFGPDVEPGPVAKSGLKVEERNGRFSLAQSSALTFNFARSPEEFLESAGSPRLEYLRPGSVGLTTVDKHGASASASGNLDSRTRITREGPLAIGLRSEWKGPSGRASTLDLTVPHSKSWVEAAWSVADPERGIVSLGLDLKLKIEGSPTLVDFGAGSTVYGQIKGQQRMELEAGPGRNGPEGWVIRQGEGEKPALFAASTARSPRPAEGRLRLVRESAGAIKSLRFWLHFVPMPVQVGAATSPQAILEPLRIEWDR